MSTNRCVEFFIILFRSWVICKNQKSPGFYTRSKQNKKDPKHLSVDIIK